MRNELTVRYEMLHGGSDAGGGGAGGGGAGGGGADTTEMKIEITLFHS